MERGQEIALLHDCEGGRYCLILVDRHGRAEFSQVAWRQPWRTGDVSPSDVAPEVSSSYSPIISTAEKLLFREC